MDSNVENLHEQVQFLQDTSEKSETRLVSCELQIKDFTKLTSDMSMNPETMSSNAKKIEILEQEISKLKNQASGSMESTTTEKIKLLEYQ
eukprot:7683080-Karenia_brevis.AAC.1